MKAHTTSSNRQKQRRRGAVTVEFALCLPLVLAVFFAAFEFCRANMLRHTADNAAYEGARAAIVPGATADDAEETAIILLDTVGASGATVEIDPETIEPDTPEVTVTVTVPMDDNGFGFLSFMNGGDIVTAFTLAREKTEE